MCNSYINSFNFKLLINVSFLSIQQGYTAGMTLL